MNRLALVVALASALGAAAPAVGYRSDYGGTTSQGTPISFVYDDQAKGQRGVEPRVHDHRRAGG